MAQATLAAAPPASPARSKNDTWLFWGSFFAIVATAFGFVIRGEVITEWGVKFGLSETEKGAILGVGLWPFAISIILFSLIIDKIGYGRSMVFAFACHVASTLMLIFAKSAAMLYWGTFIVALGNGTVEAVCNPVVATMFPREKTKWLNILHAGWPGGQVLGGLLAISLGSISGFDWRFKVALILLPTVTYGVMMAGRKFPVHERVEAGVSYMEMLRQAGWFPAWVALGLIVRQLGVVFELSSVVQIAAFAIVAVPYAALVKSPGRPMFIFLVLLMIPLATTELGTDGWITDLMRPVMDKNHLPPLTILIYTATIMMLLRFFAGSIVHRISPLGLLCVGAAIAATGLLIFSQATGVVIILAASVFALGKTFFWPTTLGVVAEQFPKGGALTMNLIAGVGMLGVGIVGAPFIGAVKDRAIDHSLAKQDSALHSTITEQKTGVFGAYNAIKPAELEKATPEQKTSVAAIQDGASKTTLSIIAILPGIMLLGYLILLGYFKSKGGYKVEAIGGDAGH